MTGQEFEDSKLLFQHFYANQSFRKAREAAEYIQRNDLDRENPLYDLLLVSILVSYGQPFSRANGNQRIQKDIVPKEHAALHANLITQRDKIYAHRDATKFELPEVGQANQIRALRVANGVGIIGLHFHLRPNAMGEVIELSRKLEEKTAYWWQKTWEKLHKEVPEKLGEYTLNVDDESKPLWLKVDPITDKPDKRFDNEWRPVPPFLNSAAAE